MRDLVKIYSYEIVNKNVDMSADIKICERKLKAQIGRNDITILNITKVVNMIDSCLDCYVDYEFWGGK